MKTFNTAMQDLNTIYEDISTGLIRPEEAFKFILGTHCMSDQYLNKCASVVYGAQEINDKRINEIERYLIELDQL